MLSGSVHHMDAAVHYLTSRQTALRVCRLPASGRSGKPLALFLCDCFGDLDQDGAQIASLTSLFDLILCELPGHGETGRVADVSLQGFAQTYASLIDCHVPDGQDLTVIGDSLGGLIGLFLVRLRPARVARLVLLDPPFRLTPRHLGVHLSDTWRRSGRAYQRRILAEIYGIDPNTGLRFRQTRLHHLVADLAQDCILIAGSEDRPLDSRLPSLVTGDDLARLRAANRSLRIAPRVRDAGHGLLLENAAGCVAALASLLRADHRSWRAGAEGAALVSA